MEMKRDETDKTGKKIKKSSCKDGKVDHHGDEKDSSDDDEGSKSTCSKAKDKISKSTSSKMSTRQKGKSAPVAGTSGNTDNFKKVCGGKLQTLKEKKESVIELREKRHEKLPLRRSKRDSSLNPFGSWYPLRNKDDLIASRNSADSDEMPVMEIPLDEGESVEAFVITQSPVKRAISYERALSELEQMYIQEPDSNILSAISAVRMHQCRAGQTCNVVIQASRNSFPTPTVDNVMVENTDITNMNGILKNRHYQHRRRWWHLYSSGQHFSHIR